MEIKNMKCAFHPAENIVNFCRNEECLLPMCPTCVRVHSNEHMSENTHGNYENIVDIYNETKKNLSDMLKSLNSCEDDLKEAFERKKQRKDLLTKKMQEMRIKMIDSINKYVDNVEKEVLHSMQTIESTLDEDFANVQEKIQHLSNEVQKDLQQLTGEKTLKTIIGHFSQEKNELYENSLEDLSGKIMEINNLDITSIKEFKLSQMSEILKSVRACYKSVFSQIVSHRPLKSVEFQDSCCSKESRSEKSILKENQVL